MQTYNTGGPQTEGAHTGCLPRPSFLSSQDHAAVLCFRCFTTSHCFDMKRLRLAAVDNSMWNQSTMTHEFVFITFYRHKIVTAVCVVSNPCYKIIGLNLYKMFRKKTISCGGPCSFLPGVIKFQHFNAHCCHVDTAVQHPVPERVKPSFVIFDIRAL